MLADLVLTIFTIKLVVCEFYDEYENFDGYNYNSNVYYTEESPTFGAGSDFGRVRRFGKSPASPYTRNIDDIKGALQKVMPRHTELFQDLSQPQILTEKSTETAINFQFDAPPLPSYQLHLPSASQYGVYEVVTPEAVQQSLDHDDETEPVIFALTPENNVVTPWFLNQYIEASTEQETSTVMMALTTHAPEMSLTHMPSRLMTHRLTRSLTHTPFTAMTHEAVRSPTHPPVRSTTTHLLVRSTIHPPIRMMIRPPVRSTIHPTVRLTTKPPAKLKIHSPVRSTSLMVRLTAHGMVKSTQATVRSTALKRGKLTAHASVRSTYPPLRSITHAAVRLTAHAPVESTTKVVVKLMNHAPTRSTTRLSATSRIRVNPKISKPTMSTARAAVTLDRIKPSKAKSWVQVSSTTGLPKKAMIPISARSEIHKSTRSTTRVTVRSRDLLTGPKVTERQAYVHIKPSTRKATSTIKMDIPTWEPAATAVDGNMITRMYPNNVEGDIYDEKDEVPFLYDKAVPRQGAGILHSEPSTTAITTTPVTTSPSVTTTPSLTTTPSVTTTPSLTTTPSVTTTPLLTTTPSVTISPAVTTTTSATTVISSPLTTTVVSTTPNPYLVFDIESFLAILANLTYEYDTNLTEVMNATLRNNTPTCKPEDEMYKKYSAMMATTTTAYSTPTTTTVAYEMPKDINNSVIAKCFVCGLHAPGIPYDSDCADAFAGDFLPLTPVNPIAKSKTSSYRKYCRYGEIYNYRENVARPRSIYGRWTGGCAVRWTDLTGLYTQRTCRNRKRPTTGSHYASKRMAKLELSLGHTESGCIISPVATLLPLSRGVSLFARFHACVCTGNWCNGATYAIPSMIAVIALAAVWVYC